MLTQASKHPLHVQPCHVPDCVATDLPQVSDRPKPLADVHRTLLPVAGQTWRAYPLLVIALDLPVT